ncbi:IF2 family translation initiation factor [Mycolicibacterium sp. 018/SC-01/001]|uniref:IF2 family translation initiation factor n=1 Tax=Mycolicibacterium sp. 018/SC-01/001 TaxID=2592069 RepID=UPI00117EAF26|nr:IF2 family translation initiation factor [Mycolicibacterium sp. 018/SC-01/001]TRW86276.1 IF2 family translation initiation factor [Mycolicibacterium sp. 018/SC-01/001]
MNLVDIPLAVLRFQYRLARTPVQLVEDRLMARWPDDAPGRLMYERALGALDAAAGNALRDAALEESGITRVQRAAALGEAVRLEQVAEEKRQQAQDQLSRKREQVAAAPKQAHDEAAQRAASAREDAEREKQQATRQAAQRTAEVKRQIAESADQSVAAAEKTKRSAQNRSKAAEKAVTDVADVEHDDAVAKRRAATQARARADRLEDLSDSEQERRGTLP